MKLNKYFGLKRCIIFHLICSLFILLISCSQKQNVSRSEQNQNIIVLSPEVAEIVCTLDGADKIAAVTRECDYPPILKNKSRVGSFSSPDLEKIISLEPDYIFLSGLEQEVIKNKLNKLNTRVYQFYPTSVDTLLHTFKKIGKLINKERKADSLINYFNSELANIPIPEEKPKVFFEVYKNPIMTVSAESFVGDVINKSGGKNAFVELARDYCRIPAERVIEANPDIIIISYPGINKKEVKERSGWETIEAIQNDRIYTRNDLDIETIIRAGPRTIKGIKTLNRIFENYEK